MLIIHFIGLAMGLGTSIGFMFLGIASTKMEEAEARKFRVNVLPMSRMGHIGLALLVISGGYLMTPYWGALGSTPLLIAKLALVVVLATLIGLIAVTARKVKAGDAAQYAKIRPLGQASLLTAVAIVVLAVLVFH